MDYIVQVTKPGSYKRKKAAAKGRLCACGAHLSIYNSSILCAVCSQKKFLAENGDK